LVRVVLNGGDIILFLDLDLLHLTVDLVVVIVLRSVKLLMVAVEAVIGVLLVTQLLLDQGLKMKVMLVDLVEEDQILLDQVLLEDLEINLLLLVHILVMVMMVEVVQELLKFVEEVEVEPAVLDRLLPTMELVVPEWYSPQHSAILHMLYGVMVLLIQDSG
tara:strand:+ start:27 stop:509 length:483 start_codon:yes stop_codon:yes gene_type:complete